jgi:flavodoxin
MKTLVAFYSRTGATKRVAKELAVRISADLEEIKDTVDRGGVKGFFISGRDAMRKRLVKLEPVKANPAEYELVIIGTPVWGHNVSSPVRTYITEQKDNFKNVAFFCTMGGSGDKKVFAEMEKIIGKKPSGTLAVTTKEAVSSNFSEKMKQFILAVNN